MYLTKTKMVDALRPFEEDTNTGAYLAHWKPTSQANMIRYSEICWLLGTFPPA